MCWVVAALLTASRAVATPSVDVTPAHVTLDGRIDVLDDSTARLAIADVKAPGAAFKPAGGRGAASFGFTHGAIWVRASIENPSERVIERWIVIDHVPLDFVALYDGDQPARLAGGQRPRAMRELDRPSPAFRVRLAPHDARTLYLRAWGDSEIILPLAMWESGALAADDARHAELAGIAFGIMLALALYNALLYVFVRDAMHLYYAMQVTCSVVWLGCLNGTLLSWLPGQIGHVPHSVNAIAASGGAVFAIAFATRFLQLRATYPRIYRGLLACIAFYVALSTAYLLGLLSYRSFNVAAQPTLILTVVAVVVVALQRWREGFTPAAYLALGWSALVLLSGVAVALALGFLPGRLGLLPHAAYASEALLLSLALADAAKRKNDHVASLNAAAARFVPREFLALLGKHELPDVKQGDQVERQMTVFFLDVRSFTTLVEGMTPDRAMAFVNGIFTLTEAPITAHRGVIDKYMGDGIMVLFERADDAVAAAIACLDVLRGYNVGRQPPIAVGIGLHTGSLMLGTVGGDQRLSCTVIGDSVNLASRIEGMTKAFGAPVLLSGETRAALADPARFGMRALGRVAAKGKAGAVELYEVLDALEPAERDKKQRAAADLAEGCRLLADGAIGPARARFLAHSGDAAAALYVDLCDRFTREGLPSRWDGVLRLEAK